MHDTYRLATATAHEVNWWLRRNCSVTPGQLLATFAWLSGVSLGVAGFFWSQGATLVMPFAVLELVAVGVAFVVYARHATDGERISLSLSRGRLVVETERAGRVERCEFDRFGLCVDMPAGERQLVEVRGGGRVVWVGRHLRPDLRPLLVREMRTALRA
jgi:uncharacterized membrane protein